MNVALVDYGAGNLHSVENALKAAGANVSLTADPEHVLQAERIVLPGVGAFQTCADGLNAIPGMAEALHSRVIKQGAPFLGICVGMQLMAETGREYGEHKGLGWVKGSVEALRPAQGIKIPHMGWNRVEPCGEASLVQAGEAYFLHSYAFAYGEDNSAICAETAHGGPVVAAVQRGNALGVQFHPEKSQKYGLDLLERFLQWKP
jgi:glutamine amidotransferase